MKDVPKAEVKLIENIIEELGRNSKVIIDDRSWVINLNLTNKK